MSVVFGPHPAFKSMLGRQALAARVAWALMGLRRFLLRVADRLVPSALPLYEMTTGVAQTHILATFVQLKIPEMLRAGINTLQPMAERLDVCADTLERFLRVACSLGLVRLGRSGSYQQTKLTLALDGQASAGMAAFARYMATPGNLTAWSALADVVATGRDAFAARGTSVWSHFNAHPQELQHFSQAMTALARMDAPLVARAYPFGRHRIVCDVGGGHGAMLAAVLRAHPHLHGFVLDQPSVVQRAHVEAELQQRMHFVAGDFFKRVPAGADAYLLRQVLHDWPDDACITILRHCRAVMDTNARLLIVDAQIEHDHAHYLGAIKDLTMGVVCGGRERSRAAMQTLLAAGGMRMVRIWHLAAPVVVWEAAIDQT